MSSCHLHNDNDDGAFLDNNIIIMSPKKLAAWWIRDASSGIIDVLLPKKAKKTKIYGNSTKAMVMVSQISFWKRRRPKTSAGGSFHAQVV